MTEIQNIFDESLAKDGLVLAVSGGPDSMAMLSLAHRFINGKFSVVTVDHHLRRTSADDAALVKKFCAERVIPCVVADVYPKEFAKENKLSVETAARILRHGALALLSKGKTVCLAHTKNDQAETVLMHLIRGSGGKGTSGMKKLSGGAYRPLLDFTKDEILEYVSKNEVPFAIDPTNRSNRYTRNFIRNAIVPRIEKLNPNAVKNIARYAKTRDDDEDYFEKQVDEIYPSLGVAFEWKGATLPNSVFKLHPALASRVVIKVFSLLGHDKDVKKVHIDAICALAENNSGKKLCLPFGLTAVKGYSGITILPLSAVKNTETKPYKVGKTVFADKTLSIGFAPQKGLRFDAAKIPEGAVIRTARQGDAFTKFGGGTKSLKKYFIDKKIPLLWRREIPLIADGEDILLIFGVEISDKIKVDEGTKSTLYAALEE